MAQPEDDGFDAVVDNLMEFVGDEDVQKGTAITVILFLVACVIYGIYLFVIAYYVQIIGVLIIGLFIYFYTRPKISYCADCGNILGRGEPSGPCSRCLCNRWTQRDPGVGMTFKNR